MAHLAASDTAAAQLVKGDPAEELDEYRAGLGDAEFTVDGFNAWTVDRRSGVPVRENLTTWGRAAQAFLAYPAVLSKDEWEAERVAGIAGDIAARDLLQTR